MEQERSTEATKLAVAHYFQQIKRDWKIVTPAFILPAIGSILVFYTPPLVIAKILGRISHQTNLQLTQLLPYVLLLGLLWALGEALWRVGTGFLNAADSRGMRRLYTQGMAFLLEKDMAFFHNNFAGSLTKRLSAYGAKYEVFMDTLSYNILSSYIPIIFAVFVLWRFSPWLVVGLLSMLSITAAIIFPLIRRRQHLVYSRERASNIMTGYMADMLGNVDTIKSFAQEDFEAQNHARNVGDFMGKARLTWDYHNQKISIPASSLYVLTNIIGLLIALSIGRNNTTQVQIIFVTFSYFSTATRVMFDFNNIYRNIESAITEAAQFTELLLIEPRIKDIDDPEAFSPKKGEIEFANMTFRYHDGGGDHLFKDFNLKISPGEKVALVGHSGGGKTTVTRLLLRFMDLDSGQILIDGQDISKVKQKDLRSAIAYVPQEPAMFHRSLTDNIRYGKQDAGGGAVKKAAKLAHADEFIVKQPKGYDTLVGERGIKLSGGQRQRIAIARAILKNAPVLVLDEATSALDSESEKLIQDALWKLMENRTAIVIAHRLSTIQRMDRIVVLEDGKIVEQGAHKDLLEQKGIYAKLWAHQSGGFLED